MKRIMWLTDLHLDFLTQDRIEGFWESIALENPDVVLIGGDTGHALNISDHLSGFEKHLACPVYFVLGNHDYYGSSIGSIRKEVHELAQQSERLVWLPDAGIVPLTSETCLVGYGSWADGRLGDYASSDVELNDYCRISEFKGLDRVKRLFMLNRLGDEAADYFRKVMPEALAEFRHVLVLTHVPPFRNACWYGRKVSDDNHLPHFSCKAVGDVLYELMQAHPHCRMTILCGHTHSGGTVGILLNLKVKAGDAEYGRPRIQEILRIE